MGNLDPSITQNKHAYFPTSASPLLRYLKIN